MYAMLIIAAAVGAAEGQTSGIEATLANIPEDGLLNFTQLAQKYGHPAVAYEVTTEDGYVSTLYNLPGDRARPVLLCHGVFDSADGWLLRGNSSLAVLLARAGYDVWALNYRGNRYARRHRALDPDSEPGFWDYSAHEYGALDQRACVDLVLRVTGRARLSVVGFSEGTTATAILGCTRPEYNDKVNVFVALAPVVFLENVRSSLLAAIIQLSPVLDLLLPPGVLEVGGYHSLLKAVLNLVCTQLVIGYELCYGGGFNPVSGVDPVGIDREFFKVIMGHFPAGTSRKNLLHFAQISLRKKFAMYDHGAAKNLKLYRSFSPPAYDVSKLTMPTVLISGRNDPVSTLEDVELLKSKLPNVLEHIVIERDKYNHLAHMWASDAPVLEYPFILKILAEHNK